MSIIDIHKRRLLHGTLLKWDEKRGYHDRDGVKPSLGPYYVVGLARGYQHWKNQTLLEEKIDEPSKPLPDLDALNAAIPHSEWELGLNGQPSEPWRFTYAIYLFSPDSGEFFTLLNSTTGLRMLWENFQERWEVMKALRGADVLALTELTERPFKTRSCGMKQRPDLKVLDWHQAEGKVSAVLFKSSQPQLPPAASSAPTEPLAQPAPQPTSQPAPQPTSRPPQGQVTFLPPVKPAKPVKPVTLGEEIKDEIPSW